MWSTTLIFKGVDYLLVGHSSGSCSKTKIKIVGVAGKLRKEVMNGTGEKFGQTKNLGALQSG